MKTIRYIVLSTLLLGLISVASPSIADTPLTDPGKNAARVIGAVGQEAAYIYPVEFIRIDDDNIAPRKEMWLEPGRYEVAVRAVVVNPPRLTGRGKRIDDSQHKIELAVEAGKRYYIGLRYNTDNFREPYTTVLFRVEDEE